MTTWYALGALILFGAALIAVMFMIDRAAYARGQSDLKLDMAERRAQRRHETRGRHHKLTPFPGDTEAFERPLANTGELRQITDELSAAAESGDFKTIHGQNAAFLRRLDLTRLYRLARERTGAAA